MEIVTSWMEEGIRQGQAEGFQQGVLNYTLRLLKHKFGEINSEIETQVRRLSTTQLEELGEALFDFSTIDDLTHWLSEERAVGNGE